MKKTLLSLLIVMSVSACVKLEIKPGSVVADTVDAGKNLYTSVKRNRNGEDQREYSHSLASKNPENDTANIQLCKNQIMENIAASSVSLKKILSESSGVEGTDGTRKVHCKMMVLVATK